MNSNELPLTTEALTDRSIAIKLIGVGGAGSNAVDRLKMENLERLQMAVINTDYQALSSSPVQEKVLIGHSITRGLGAGGDPDLGYDAADVDREKIANAVKDCDLVFLAVGMGGGTGSGAAPIVAEIASEQGALVIAFATMPFSFEGGRRAKQAEEGLAALRRACDAVIPLPNDMLLQQAADGESALDSFARADEWVGRGVRSLWSMLFRTGLINLDFATLRQAFHTRGGKTLFSLGNGAGENAVAETITSLKMCPLVHTPDFSRKADRLLVNIVGGTDLTLPKVNEIMTAVTDQFGRESHVIWGAVIDEALQNKIEVCVLGTTDIGTRGVAPRRPTVTARPQRNGLVAQASVQTATPQLAAVIAGTQTAETTSQTAGVAEAASTRTTAATTTPAGSTRKKSSASESDQMSLPMGAKSKIAQEEFTFDGDAQRGSFEKSDRNLYEGQDLDVPTFLRRGIKIAF